MKVPKDQPHHIPAGGAHILQHHQNQYNMKNRIDRNFADTNVSAYGTLLQAFMAIMVLLTSLSVNAQTADDANFQLLDSTAFFLLKDSLDKAPDASFTYHFNMYIGLTDEDMAWIIGSYRAGFNPDLPEKQAFSNSVSRYGEAMATVTFDRTYLYIASEGQMGYYNEVHVICGELQFRE